MGDPILRLATRATARTRATAWGIAFACMVLVGALSLADGLRHGVDSVTARLDLGPSVYASADDLLDSRIRPDDLVGVSFDYSALRLHIGKLEVNGISLDVVSAAWSDHPGGNSSGTTPFPAGPYDVALDAGLREAIETRTGRPVDPFGNLTLLDRRLTELPFVGPPPSRPPLAADMWAWIRPELLVAMNLSQGGFIQALITEDPIDPGLAASLGLRPVYVVGAVGFVRASVEEASRALGVLVLVVAAVIGLLVYHAMSLEVHQRYWEIRVLRSLGAAPRTVGMVYEGQALALATFGGTMGSVLGILAAHGIVSFAPLLGLPNLVILTPPFAGVALAYALSFLSAGVAGIVPSRRVARLVRTTREAGRC